LLSHLINVVDGTVEKVRGIEKKCLTNVVRIVRTTPSNTNYAPAGACTARKTKKAAFAAFFARLSAGSFQASA
jgi:hypothetical protein